MKKTSYDADLFASRKDLRIEFRSQLAMETISRRYLGKDVGTDQGQGGLKESQNSSGEMDRRIYWRGGREASRFRRFGE